MPYVKRLIRLGRSSAIVLDKPMLEQLEVAADGEVEVKLERNAIVIRPHRYATDEEFKKAADHVFTKRRRLMERLAK